MAATSTSPEPSPDKSIIRDYNQDDYRKFWDGDAKSFLHKFELDILQRLMPTQPGWFIDVGCGYGRLVPNYLRPDRKIVLFDYAINLLELAANTYPDENIFFIAGNSYALPFRNDVFDAGISIRTFHHMKIPQAFLNELGRVMCAEANVVVEYSNKRNLFRIFRHGFKCFRRDHEEYSELLFGTHPAYFSKLARQAGFLPLRNSGTGIFDRLLGKLPFFRLPIGLSEMIADRILGPLRLAPLNFVELRKSSLERFHIHRPESRESIMDILRCPACGGDRLEDGKNALKCCGCERLFPKKDKIIDLRYSGS
jgi:SAM-dependent methyltransferase